MPVDRLPELIALTRKTPNKPLVWYGLAMEYRSRSLWDEAIQAFTRCLEVDPGYVPALFQAGLTLEEAGKHPEAVAMLRRGVEAAEARSDKHAANEMRDILESWGEE